MYISKLPPSVNPVYRQIYLTCEYKALYFN
jgi:hypothetical protein